jgi:hypothetical protein
MATIKKKSAKKGFVPFKKKSTAPVAQQQMTAPQGPPMAKKGKSVKKCCKGAKVKKGK